MVKSLCASWRGPLSPKELRSAADDAFRGNMDMGRASKSAAGALEDALADHFTQAGNSQALSVFQDARQLIAKTYSVEKARSTGSGAEPDKAQSLPAEGFEPPTYHDDFIACGIRLTTSYP